MSQIQNYFENNTSNAIHKWRHYFDIYDFWFKKYKNKPVVILEIGVYQGGSLNMWSDYFGEEAKIFAIDINPLCKQFETENIKIFIGSQEDREFLKYVKSQIPKVDIVIDDGGHTMKQQIVSFEELYEHINEDGIYLCEDLHTSYLKNYGGGFKNPNSFIEYSKNLIDSINAWHSKESKLKVDSITKNTYALHYYDSVLVVEKKVISPPVAEMKGEIIIPIYNFPTPKLKQSLMRRIFKKVFKTNLIMSKFRTFFKVLKHNGLNGVVMLLKNKFYSYQINPIENINLYESYFENKKGIEIGGPSAIFSLELPIYPIIQSLDGCNFSSHTTWEGDLAEGDNFNYFENKIGHQYICEASNLMGIPNEKYDFIIASHCLEHCANTLKTVEEWLRVIKKGGAILLILPDKRYTFDHNRPTTTFNHLVDDYNNNIDETDLTHLNEILKFHDLNFDSPAGTKEQFKDRSMDNFNNRCLHHHIFDIKLLEKIYKYYNIKIVRTAFVNPFHQIILGVKL